MADKRTTQTQSLESLLAYASQEMDLTDLLKHIEARRAKEEEEDGENTNPGHGDPEPVEDGPT